MFHCPVGVWVIAQNAIILSATVRSPTVKGLQEFIYTLFKFHLCYALYAFCIFIFYCDNVQKMGPYSRFER